MRICKWGRFHLAVFLSVQNAAMIKMLFLWRDGTTKKSIIFSMPLFCYDFLFRLHLNLELRKQIDSQKINNISKLYHRTKKKVLDIYAYLFVVFLVFVIQHISRDLQRRSFYTRPTVRTHHAAVCFSIFWINNTFNGNQIFFHCHFCSTTTWIRWKVHIRMS